MKTTVTAEVEINFKEGKKTIEMLLKQPHEIANCTEGKAIVLNVKTGNQYTGIFKGMDCEEILLGSLSGKGTIGINTSAVNDYFEQV